MTHESFLAVETLTIELTRREDFVWLRLLGEADIATLQQLRAVLEQVLRDRATFVFLQLAELKFADTATVCQLTDFARRVRRTGREVQTFGASRTLRKLAQVLGVQGDLALT